MKISFIGDQKGKVHHARCKVFSKFMKHEFAFFTASTKHLSRRCAKCDIVYYASFLLYLRVKIRHDFICGSATSWKCLEKTQRRKTLRCLRKLTKISANNLRLTNKLKKYRKDIMCIPNGVEIDFFCPQEKKHFDTNNISIGWVGNYNRSEKQYRTILCPVVKRLGKKFKFNVIATDKSASHKRLRNKEQMLKFYRSIDFYLVTSSKEGTPNPALEAASCGVPIITTRVGNMPELISDDINGFFVESNIDNICGKLNSLRSISTDHYLEMRQKIRNEIVENWSWKKSCSLFEKMFNL